MALLEWDVLEWLYWSVRCWNGTAGVEALEWQCWRSVLLNIDQVSCAVHKFRHPERVTRSYCESSLGVFPSTITRYYLAATRPPGTI